MTFFACDSVTHKGNSNTWFTPKWIMDRLGMFDLDPCTESFRPFDTALKHFEYDKGEDGLMLSWNGRIWLNPPYGKNTGKWLDKLRKHGNGIAIVFTAFETSWGQSHSKTADGIFLLSGRIAFIDKYGKKRNNAGKGSCLIIYGENNLDIKLEGILMVRLGLWRGNTHALNVEELCHDNSDRQPSSSSLFSKIEGIKK